MTTANIRFDVTFETPLTVWRPLSGVIVLTCDCGNKHIGSEQITAKSELSCFTCPKCGLHLCRGWLQRFRDACFSGFRRRAIESN